MGFQSTGGSAVTALFGIGLGTDGPVTLGAGTTTLSKDMDYTTLVVPSGSTLRTNGYAIRATTLVQVDSGGSILTFANPGASGATTHLGGVAIVGSLGGGVAGADGANSAAGNGVQGTAQFGGSGGGGGLSTNAAAGATSTAVAPIAANGVLTLFAAMSGNLISPVSLLTPIKGGCGGGFGAAKTGVAFGGGGGAGGGVMLIVTPNLIVNGTITAPGGDGGAGTTETGGAGGGGGGVILLTYHSKTGSGTITVAGGAGGTAGSGGGGAGQAGGVGNIYQFVV